MPTFWCDAHSSPVDVAPHTCDPRHLQRRGDVVRGLASAHGIAFDFRSRSLLIENPTSYAGEVTLTKVYQNQIGSTELAGNLPALKAFGNTHARVMNPTNAGFEERAVVFLTMGNAACQALGRQLVGGTATAAELYGKSKP
jgi:hypothetical protein